MSKGRTWSSSKHKTVERLLQLLDAVPDFFICTGEPGAELSLSPPKPGKLEAMLKIATVAPLGKGTKTIVDTSRRRCLEIAVAEAERENLIDARWEGLDAALRHVESTLPFCPGTRLAARPDKLLIYREGDFFQSHFDSKKDPSHLLSLSVVCDGDWEKSTEGGDVVFDKRPGKPSWSGKGGPGSFGCWYASEEHSVTSLSGTGYRVVLTYIVTATRAVVPKVAQLALEKQGQQDDRKVDEAEDTKKKAASAAKTSSSAAKSSSGAKEADYEASKRNEKEDDHINPANTDTKRKATSVVKEGDGKSGEEHNTPTTNERAAVVPKPEDAHNVNPHAALKTWISQARSTLSQLPRGVANDMVTFLDTKSQAQLANTCRDLREALALHKNEGAIRIVATALQQCNKAVGKRGGKTGFQKLVAPTIGFLLSHRYAFDSIDVCHLKGKDAIFGSALLQTFPKLNIRITQCVLREEKKHDREGYGDYSFGVYQKQTKNFRRDTEEDDEDSPVEVPKKYRYLLPPGKTSLSAYLFHLMTGTDMENDEGPLSSASWPFFGGVRFVFSASAARRFMAGQSCLDYQDSLWGNEGHFDTAWYKGGALLLEGLNASVGDNSSSSSNEVVEKDDIYEPVWWAFKDMEEDDLKYD